MVMLVQRLLKNHFKVVVLTAEVLQKKYMIAFNYKMQNKSESR